MNSQSVNANRLGCLAGAVSRCSQLVAAPADKGTMRVASLFTGIGGFDLAFERAGATVTLQSEIDARCQELLAKRFPGIELIPDVRDVRQVDADLICGGFPCQDISVAGKRAGLAGERSGLWWEFARIVDESRPAWVLVENVAGLLSSNGGRDMGTILAALGDIGYGFAYRVLDAQFFGVPQRRRRVFIVGHRGDWRRAGEVLLEPEGGCWNPPTRGGAGPIASALTQASLGGGGPDDNNAQANHLIAGALTGRIDRGGVNSEGHDGHLIAFHATQTPVTSSDTFPTMGSSSATLGVGNELGVRKLMPLECERLQGFPDGWTEGFPDTTRYRMLGNAVAVPVVEWIARRITHPD